MYTLSTAQEDVLQGRHFRVGFKCEIESSSGAFRDMSDWRSEDWLVGMDARFDVDQPVADATVLLRRDASTAKSLAPLRTDSTANQPTAGAYAPAIAVGREVKLSVATVAASCSPCQLAMNPRPYFAGFFIRPPSADPVALSWRISPRRPLHVVHSTSCHSSVPGTSSGTSPEPLQSVHGSK
mgnify:CR=1 FL=1